uniref:Zinc finger CCCH domain-containing protein 14 n=1 Tax=Anopheles epiroticus TaxID=199890 RepID=A0A182PS70_9DIPT
MDNLGTEIGQKMRSAVKAKLIELGTGSASGGYIDDELPDYVMIMVANKRSRQQMVDDLSLFLGAQTEIFVNWLHQVLQKLQEVTLPASVASKSKESAKRKSSEVDDKKKDKKRKDKKAKRRDRSTDGEEAAESSSRRSETDDNTPPRPAVVLPATSITEVFAHQYIEKAKKSLEADSVPPVTKKPQPSERSESQDRTKSETPSTSSDPVSSIADLASSSVVQKHHKELCELKEIEERISAAKRHLKSLGTDISDDDDEDTILLKISEEDLLGPRDRSNQKAVTLSNKPTESTATKTRQRITMGTEEPAKKVSKPIQSTTPPAPSRSTEHPAGSKKRSVLDRLGTKNSTPSGGDREKSAKVSEPKDSFTKDGTKAGSSSNTGSSGTKSTIISLSAHRREEREIYVPLFRRKEAAEEQSASKNQPRPPATSRGDYRQKDGSREANHRDPRSSPSSRLPPISRTDATRARSRETNFRRVDRDRDRDRERIDEQPIGRKSRPRERSRSREWIRESNHDRSDSGGRIKNGGSETTVRGRVGSRVIVLPPKPEYNEDVIEVPVASVIKVQPRPIVPKATQPCKNLLLKAMAEAQRSTVADLKKTISNTAPESSIHRTDIKRKLVIEIPGGASSHLPVTDVQYERIADAHYTTMLDGPTFHNHREEAEQEEVHEVDITHQVLMEDCDVDEEFKDILQNDYNAPKASVSREYAIEMEVTEEDAAMAEQELAAIENQNTKFVVTLDGAFKPPVERELSPSHTPPPPPAMVEAAALLAKGRMSVKDRIGFKVGPGREPAKKSPIPKDSKEMEETLKKRKERFNEKLIAAPTTTKQASKKSTSPTPATIQQRSRSTSRAQRSPKPLSRSSHNSQSSRQRTPSLSPERPRSPAAMNASPTESRSKRSDTGRNVSNSPNQLNELLLQRTKELMDDSVSSSPIYMSKTDYDKMEPSSRKRKRVSPIQFDLTDEDERHDSDDDYHHHHRDRDRGARSREENRAPQRSPTPDSDDRSSKRKESRREWEREGGERRDGREARQKSPGKKIKKLESSRKFDDIPPLLSAVALPGADGKNNKLGGGGTLKERCKYFPNCRQGDACEFLHPTTPCKAFPSCKFGDKCLYLHPMCKYDQTCHRLDCNYMHSKSAASSASGGLLAPPLASSVVPVQNYKTISAKPLPPVCKFYPNCVNSQCQYLHPKMCHFGKHCANKIECNFYHYDIPTKELHDASSKDKFSKNARVSIRVGTGVEASEHVLKLMTGTVTNVFLHIDPAWSYERWIESLEIIGRHEYDAGLGRCHTVETV